MQNDIVLGVHHLPAVTLYQITMGGAYPILTGQHVRQSGSPLVWPHAIGIPSSFDNHGGILARRATIPSFFLSLASPPY